MENPWILPPGGNGPYRVLRGFAGRAVGLLHASQDDPESVQRARLRSILAGLRGTAFARDHGLDGREDLDGFRERVPVRDHDSLLPWLGRVRAGERRVLTRARVRMMVRTSGTTGPARLLPVTRAWERSVAEAQVLWRLALVRDREELTRGGVLALVSRPVGGRLPSGLPWGSNTGRMRARQPWIVRLRYVVPEAVARLDDSDARLYSVLRFALQRAVSSITTANPSTLLLLARRMRDWRKPLALDLAAGTLEHGPARDIDPALRARVARHLRRVEPPRDWRPARAWPLVGVQCWKGGAAPFFLERLPAAFGRELPVRDVGITASEGFFAIPMSDEGSSGLAWLGGHFLEFVREDGAVRCAWELVRGRRYRLVVTTSAGLYRYDLDDLVEVTGHAGGAPLLRFVRRATSMLNITGEKLAEDQVVAAVREVLGGLPVAGFSAGHLLAEVPAVRLVVEGQLPAGRLAELAAALDGALCRLNVEYASKRRTGRLAPVRLERLPAGTYQRLRAARVRSGAPEAQVKDPVLLLDPEAWEELNLAARSSG